MRAAGVEDIETCISRRKNTVEHYIDACPILDICIDTDIRLGFQTPTSC